MKLLPALQEVAPAVDGAVHVTPKGKVKVRDVHVLRQSVDQLVEKSALGNETEQRLARWLIWECALETGIRPASVNDLYMARGRGETRNDFTVPAMNLRALAFDAARAAIRAAMDKDAGAFIFEIARSEIGYTAQRPAEYAASVLAAAIKEGFAGPLFIQGDHFQVSLKKYQADPESELQAVRGLTEEAVASGFYNIDVDTSTLVDLSEDSIAEQQAENFRRCAELTAFIRGLQPKGVTVSVGGEIGEVGGKNSTETELRAFMDGYNAQLLETTVGGRKKRGGIAGISKISIQTGTSHGGVVLPDGTVAKVKVDFDTLLALSRVARGEYGYAGAVQHGASTLPQDAFGKFVESEACEVHLATNFQNMLYDRLPKQYLSAVYAYVNKHYGGDRKEGQTDEQFHYENRKRALGPFKQAFWDLPDGEKAAITSAWEQQFAMLFEQLALAGTRKYVDQTIKAAKVAPAREFYFGKEVEQEEVKDLSD